MDSLSLLLRPARALALAVMVHGLVPLAIAQVGRMERGTISSAALAGSLFNDPTNRSYAVYLPPSYGKGARRYPVFYMLHGWTGNFESHLDDMPPALDRMIAARQIGEMIAVFVDGSNAMRGSFYRTSPATGDYETYITRDLVDLIDARYRTLATNASRAVAGFSMGGYGALHLALNHPDVFSVVCSHAGYYDTTDGMTSDALKAIARAKPTTAAEIARMAIRPQALIPFLPTAAPDPARPPFFYDPPFTFENGQYTTNSASLQRLRDADVLHGDLERFLGRTARLRAIQVVHGTADTLVFISQARSLHQALSSAALDHDYQEHGGEHQFLIERALAFLSQSLVGAERYIEPPRLSLLPTGSELSLRFGTQVDVEYHVEHTSSPNSANASWTQVATLAGTGADAIVPVPIAGSGDYFRVHASNRPSP